MMPRIIVIFCTYWLFSSCASFAQADDSYKHWPITIRHSDTFDQQGMNFVLDFHGHASNRRSCYKAIQLETNLGLHDIEIGQNFHPISFGCDNASSSWQTTIIIYNRDPKEFPDTYTGDPPQQIVIYRAMAKTVTGAIVDITKDLKEEIFQPLPITIQLRLSSIPSETELRRRLSDTEKFSKDLGS